MRKIFLLVICTYISKVDALLSTRAARTPPKPAEVLPQPVHLDEFRNKTEMIAMTTGGLAFSGALVYVLGTQGDILDSVGVVDNIVDAALPLTATDVVSVALGEGIAGIVAALTSALTISFSNRSFSKTSVNEAVADSNFFVARASAVPLFRSFMSGPLATASSAILAIVPYELYKAVNREKAKRDRENALLQDLLDEEQAMERRNRIQSWSWFRKRIQQATPAVVDLETLESVDKANEEALVVEVFADVIKWLGYGVLSAEFSGKVILNGMPLSLFPGAEGAVFGILVGTASQIYTDILYAYFGLGGETIRQKVLKRNPSQWTSAIFSRSISTGVLFGVYESAQIPAKIIVTTLLSGGVESCVGSEDYNMCVETFLADNPPPPIGASPEAELRALITSLASLWNRFTLS